jgi:glutamine amidotransferase
VSGVCDYGVEFCAAIERDNLHATQFHPEKSHKAGIALLANWTKKVSAAC